MRRRWTVWFSTQKTSDYLSFTIFSELILTCIRINPLSLWERWVIKKVKVWFTLKKSEATLGFAPVWSASSETLRLWNNWDLLIKRWTGKRFLLTSSNIFLWRLLMFWHVRLNASKNSSLGMKKQFQILENGISNLVRDTKVKYGPGLHPQDQTQPCLFWNSPHLFILHAV